MGVMKTFLPLLLAVLATVGPVRGQTSLEHVFAECVGRLSAERDHAWLVGNPNADLLDQQRAAFVSLLDATVPQDQASNALHYRINVKVAHASLLTLASFGSDDRRAKHAQQLAQQRVKACQGLLLGY
jgi:hypothetical protein